MKFIARQWQIIVWGFFGWTLFGVFFALQNYVNAAYLGQSALFSRILIIWLTCGYAWALLTPAVIYLAQTFPLRRGNLFKNLPLHLFAAAAAAALHLSIYILIQQIFFPNPRNTLSFWQTFQGLSVAEFHVDLLTYWILVGIWHLREINRQNIERERETARMLLQTSQLETNLTQARLDALKMQIHPHFLFNTLNSISVLMRGGDAEAADKMLVRLSELLRAALKTEGKQEVLLKDELEFLRGYLEIEQVRFQDRLKIDFAVENETLNAKVPNLILQPIVENAIRHGIAPLEKEGKILIESRRENGFVEISVKDNGAGLDENSKNPKGIGLKNTRERLEKLYGESQNFEVAPNDGGGICVTIRIPYREKEL